nr:hypothetical protein [Tanacetum cinerariifolium]
MQKACERSVHLTDDWSILSSQTNYQNEDQGFMKLRIHHVGGLWIWIQFPSSSSPDNFQTNTSLKSIYSCIKTATPSFKVDERIIWIEIRGIPICAWGSNASKKVADMFGKFMFFEAEESTKMSSSRIFSTKSHNFVSERVLVEVHGVNYDVHVHELETWNINIVDETLDSSYNIDVNDHNLILLHVSKSDFGPTPFNLFHSWLLRDSFDDSWLLRDSFDEVIKMELPKLEEPNFGRKFLSHEKFRLLKARIKQWHSETKASNHITKHDSLQLIKSIEEKIEAGYANDDNRDSRIKLRQELDFVLLNLGFGSKWRSWIKACLSLSRAAILVNYSPSLEFSIKHGLRQGDHLSPFFILVMEGFHNALFTAVSSGLIRGVKFGYPEVTISHLFYVDNVIITTELNANGLDSIIRVLQVFYLASGLKINIRKSNVYSIGVSDVDVSSMAINSGRASRSFPFTYLGLPIGSNMSLKLSWKVLLDKFQSKLSSWKANLLSIRGRHTIIKAVIYSLDIYYFSIFKVPESVLNSLKRSRAMFFGKEGGFDNNGCIYNGTWARIVGSSNFLHSNNIIPNSSFRFQAGCGTHIRFCKDTWVGDSPFYIRYNRLYRLECEKDCLITERIDHDQWRWNWSRHNLGARNSVDLLDMLFEISSAEINEVEDTCVWSLGTDETFSVKNTRCIIDSKILPSLAPSTVWYKNIPRKVNIFIWRLIFDHLPHKLNLFSCGIDI